MPVQGPLQVLDLTITVTQLKRRLSIGALALAAGLLLNQCQGEAQTPSSETSEENPVTQSAPVRPNAKTAPEFSLLNLQGTPVSLSQYRGRVVLVDFWATWCGPCRRTIPDLKALYQSHNGEGFEVLGIALERRGLENLQAYVKQSQIPYPILIGNAEVVGQYGNFKSIPTAFLIGRDGTIRNRYVGMQPKYVLEKAIQELLAEPAA